MTRLIPYAAAGLGLWLVATQPHAVTGLVKALLAGAVAVAEGLGEVIGGLV